MISLSDLLEAQTREDAKASIYAVMEDLGLSVTGWKPGAVVRTIISGVSVLLEAGLRMQNRIARAGFREHVLDRAWAVMNAEQVYGYTPRTATFAAGELTIDNTKGWDFPDVQPGELIVQASSTKKNYTNTEVFSIGPLQTGVIVRCRALESGSASSIHATGIDTLVTAYLGLEVSNAEAWAGLDEETIEEINQACDDQLDSKSAAGPAGAYAAAARAAVRQDGTAIGCTRFRTVSSNGVVTLYCATATGGVAGDVNDPATDLGAIAVAMQAWAVPTGTTALPATATPVTTDIEYTAVFTTTSGVTVADRETAIETALGAFFATEPIGGHIIPPAGGKLFVDALEGVIRAASPGAITVAVTTPAADVDLTIDEVVQLGTVTPHVSEVAG